MRLVIFTLLVAGFALTGYSLLTLDRAFADGSGSAVFAPAVPDPTTQPAEALGMVDSLWRQGAITPAMIVVAFFVLTILQAKFTWFTVGYRAVVVSAAIGALGFLVDGIANGRTPNAGMIMIALFVSLAQAQRLKPAPTAPTPGKTTMLTLVASLALSGCGWLKSTAREGAAIVVDCTKGELAGAVNELAPIAEKLVLDAVDSSGKVDWSPVKEYARGLASNLGRCVLLEGAARVLTPKPDDPGAAKVGGIAIDHAAVRAGLVSLKGELFPGATYVTSGGAL